MAIFANALISSAIAAKLLLRSEVRLCGVEQRHGAFPEGLQKQCKLLWTALKLRMLAMLELLPFGWIVDESIAQLCALCNIS
jgi:hypothetical protein